MNIETILNLTDFFYKKATNVDLLFTYAQGNNIYQKLKDTAKTLKDNPNYAVPLLVLAEIYKKALAMNGGYFYVKQFAENLFNEYSEEVNADKDEDSEDDETEFEAVINELLVDLRSLIKSTNNGVMPKAGTKDNPEVLKELRSYKDILEKTMIGQFLAQEDEMATGVFDETGGVSAENAQKGFGRGYSSLTRALTTNKITRATYYKTKSELLLDEIEEAKDPKELKYYSTLQKAYSQMPDLLIEMDSLEKKMETELKPDPADQQKYAQLEDTYNALRKIVNNQAKYSYVSKLTLEKSELENKVKDAKTSDRDKFLADQRIKLIDVLLSKDANKQKEILARKEIIKGMGFSDKEAERAGVYNNLTPDYLKKLLQMADQGKSERHRRESDVSKNAARFKGTILGDGTLLYQKGVEFRSDSIGRNVFASITFDAMMQTNPDYQKAIAEINSLKASLKELFQARAKFDSKSKDYKELTAKIKELGSESSTELGRGKGKFKDQYKALWKACEKNILQHPDPNIVQLYKVTKLANEYGKKIEKAALAGEFGPIGSEKNSVDFDTRSTAYTKYDEYIAYGYGFIAQLKKINTGSEAFEGASYIQNMENIALRIIAEIEAAKQDFADQEG